MEFYTWESWWFQLGRFASFSFISRFGFHAFHVVCGVAGVAGCSLSDGARSDDWPFTNTSVWVGRWGDSRPASLRKFPPWEMARWPWSAGAAGAGPHENIADGSTVGMFLWSRWTALMLLALHVFADNCSPQTYKIRECNSNPWSASRLDLSMMVNLSPHSFVLTLDRSRSFRRPVSVFDLSLWVGLFCSFLW